MTARATALRAAAAWLLLAGAAGDPCRAAGPPERAGPSDRFPGAGESYLVARDGALLWARRPALPHAPASLAKLMTALVAVEAGGSPDAWVRVSRRAARESGARLGLRAGDELAPADALAAMLVASANDACLALAEHVAGSAGAFVDRMNRRAAALGLVGTRFEDPCGHDRPGQRTTAADLLVLARAVLAAPVLRELVARERVTLTTRAGRRLDAGTRNALLGRARGVRGVKTGTTDAAGRCVVALAERDGHEVIVVLLGAPDRWFTAAALIDAAFDEARSGG
jgi:D-alanyl-D-alanine carboxypeptidase (penicillin-binding protein 5/6)